VARRYFLCQLRHAFSPIQLRKPLFECTDGVQKIVAAGCHRPGEDRIFCPVAVKYAVLFLFCSYIAVENVDDAADVGNQCFCLQHFPCWGRVPKMTLVFHCILQNDPDSQRLAPAPRDLRWNRKNSAKGFWPKKKKRPRLGEAEAEVYRRNNAEIGMTTMWPRKPADSH
jgi:hypothetical protein